MVPDQVADEVQDQPAQPIGLDAIDHSGIGIQAPSPVHSHSRASLPGPDFGGEDGGGEIGHARGGPQPGRRHLAGVERHALRQQPGVAQQRLEGGHLGGDGGPGGPGPGQRGAAAAATSGAASPAWPKTTQPLAQRSGVGSDATAAATDERAA